MSSDSNIGQDVRETQRAGWNLKLAERKVLPVELREAAIALALQTATSGGGTRIRRSTHAETWLVKLEERDLFVKIVSAAAGWARVKRFFRNGPAAHVATITEMLNRDGFRAPLPMLWGTETRTGREIIVTERAQGMLLPRFLRERGSDIERKRAVLHALGCEIARLHAYGYIHGDLTPFNILVEANRASFTLLDHERTQKTWLAGLVRPRLRNFVQLGHFSLAGVTRTDRMRVWRGYVGARGRTVADADLQRAIQMIQARHAADDAKTRSHPNQIITSGQAGKA